MLNSNEKANRNKLKDSKPIVFEKMQKLKEKFDNGESIAIMHLQYDYKCNFTCQHCSIKNMRKPDGRKITPEDIKELSKQAHELGLARWVITGGEPLVFKDLDKIVEAIDPTKFYINMDTNGWLLTPEKARHLKEIGIDRIQLSLDSFYAVEHDAFRNKIGSHHRALQAISNAKKAGLGIFINTVCTKERLYSIEFRKFLEFFNGLDVGVYVSFAKPVGEWEGRTDILIDKADREHMEELEKKYNVYTHFVNAYGIDMGCIAVQGMITITQYGDVLPCQYMQISLGNIYKDKLKSIIDTGMKYFGHYIDTCLMAEDKQFLEKYIHPLQGKELPVHYTEVFKDGI